jgi:hypothetical protein
MAEPTKTNARRAIIGPVIGSYVVLATPKANDHGEMRYSMQGIFPKTDKAVKAKLDKIVYAAILACPLAGNDPAKAKKLLNNPKFGKPVRDADEEDREGAEYQGCYFFNVGTNDKKGRPGCVLRNGTKLTDPDEIRDEMFSGAKYQISVTAFYYDNSGNKGVALALNNVMKWADGKRLDGSVDVEDEFADLISDDDEIPFGEDDGFDDAPARGKPNRKPAKPADEFDDFDL